MNLGQVFLAVGFIFLSTLQAQEASGGAQTREIPLSVASGAPLRLYLTKPVPKRLGAPVEGKIIEPVFAFDREVVPAGSSVTGKVSQIQSVSKQQRFRAILNGDFTPLHNAQVEFSGLTLPDGRTLPLHTLETMGLNSIYTEPSNRKNGKAQPQAQNGGILGTAKQSVKDKIRTRTTGITDMVRGPNKKEKAVDFLWAKLPYHPQYLRRGSRFDATLRDPLQFGAESVKAEDLTELGSQPGPDSVVRARLLTDLNSASAKPGQTVEAVLSAPLFSRNHKLVAPEGTRLVGTVTAAKKARSFHRPGQLRFQFQNVVLPAEIANWKEHAPASAPLKTQATLEAAEGSGRAPIKVDSEGGVQAKESKTRFLAPVISLIIASRAADGVEEHHRGTVPTGESGNVSGRTLGGGSGFGLVGVGLSQSSPYIGMAFGYYGLAWSVYSNVIARGGDVQFDKNAMIDVGFGGRTAPPASKLRESGD